jgi:outer membrane protein TolC
MFEAKASLDDYRTAALSLTAEVARTWYRLLEAELQVAVLDEQIDANQKILSLIEPRVATQRLRGVDLLRQEALVESTREERIDAEADAQVLRNQLAVLTGLAPGAVPVSTSPTLATLPALPATGVPIEQVRRRPDIIAARNRVISSDQELGAALRDQYPRLNLEASAGSATGIFEDFIASFAAGLIAPLSDGGRRVAEIDRTRAQRDRLRADYAQAVLVAFREVENALVEETRQGRRLESLERQLSLTERSSARLRDEYLNGQGSYIEVLSALTNEQELRRELLTTKRLQLEARVGLYRALAGSPLTR